MEASGFQHVDSACLEKGDTLSSSHPSADAFREAFLALPCISDPLRTRTFLHGAEIYQLGGAKGFAIRSSADCLIAAIAIENRIPVWHKDRDFSTIARFTSLRAVTQLQSGP